jgi:hypothetical protein
LNVARRLRPSGRWREQGIGTVHATITTAASSTVLEQSAQAL